MTMKPTQTVDAYQKRLMNKMHTLELAGDAAVFWLDFPGMMRNETLPLKMKLLWRRLNK